MRCLLNEKVLDVVIFGATPGLHIGSKSINLCQHTSDTKTAQLHVNKQIFTSVKRGECDGNRIENPRVLGSIPRLATKHSKATFGWLLFFVLMDNDRFSDFL